MIKIEKYTAAFVLFMVLIILFLLLYALNKGVPISDKFYKSRRRISHNDSFFTLHLSSCDLIIKWDEVEAIFMANFPPTEGDNHTMEYRLILNKEPLEIRKDKNTWLDNFLSFPKEKYPLVIIDNYNYCSTDFYNFHILVKKYLIREKNIETDISPKRFFGNKVEIIKNKDSIIMTPSGKVRVEGIQLVFDRGNDIKDKRLLEYRKITLE
ncbi:hypothetical protein [Capnocytophaga granulosa]|uniref:hypothetical protein n=1 Tax=Capnocytophaga granulosa TaxID=45242 RepID=UPI003857B18A